MKKKPEDKTIELDKTTNPKPVDPEIISETEDALEEEITLDEDFQEELVEASKLPQRAEIVERVVVEKKAKKVEETFEQRKQKTKAILDAQEKVMVVIPREKGEHENAALPVQINGLRFLIKKGEGVLVPKDVATLVNQSNKGIDLPKILKEMSNVTAGTVKLEK